LNFELIKIPLYEKLSETTSVSTFNNIIEVINEFGDWPEDKNDFLNVKYIFIKYKLESYISCFRK
jgi:hypothetical protein